jgi:hypothetical protein
MFRLIEVDFASAGKAHLGDETPLRFLNFTAFHVLLRQRGHFGFQVIAHEVKLVKIVIIRGMECRFCRRQGKNQPAVTGVYGFETEDIAEKYAVRFGVFAVDNHVRSSDHS